MHPNFRSLTLSASALAVALLVSACGGTDAEPPPDTEPPTVVIADDVSDATASGPVTFTFTFSEDVGTSFVAEDVLVTGGSAGTLTKVSATVYTLVVTPPEDSSGTLEVSVAASKFSDLASNDNVAGASASQAYSTLVTPPPSGTVIADFDDVSPPVAGYEGAEGSAIEAGPAGGGSGNSFKVLRSGGQVYALGVVSATVPLAADRRTVSAQVYSPAAGIPMVMKLEGPGGASTGDTSANEAVVAGWQTLTWTFASADVSRTYDTIVLLPNLGTVDAPPGQSYYFDSLVLLAAAGGGGGGGSGALAFSTGFSAGGRTIEGGEYGGFSGSNLDGYGCSGDPASCGSGGGFTPDVAAADSFFYYYYQTATPATDLYMGIYVQAPGVVGGFTPDADTGGVQVTSQTQLKFKLGQNGEWFGSATNNFMIVVDLGKRFTVGDNPACRLQLRRVVTPTAAAATDYSIPLDSFALVQDCAGAVGSVSAALAASPISQISFQGVGGGIALSDGTRTSGANLSVPVDGVYPTTVVLVGGITIE